MLFFLVSTVRLQTSPYVGVQLRRRPHMAHMLPLWSWYGTFKNIYMILLGGNWWGREGIITWVYFSSIQHKNLNPNRFVADSSQMIWRRLIRGLLKLIPMSTSKLHDTCYFKAFILDGWEVRSYKISSPLTNLMGPYDIHASNFDFCAPLWKFMFPFTTEYIRLAFKIVWPTLIILQSLDGNYIDYPGQCVWCQSP